MPLTGNEILVESLKKLLGVDSVSRLSYNLFFLHIPFFFFSCRTHQTLASTRFNHKRSRQFSAAPFFCYLFFPLNGPLFDFLEIGSLTFFVVLSSFSPVHSRILS
jgi:hypothetical protein